MKYCIETTMEATCEIHDTEKFEKYLSGDFKEYFWDYEDDHEGAVENIIHQFYLDDGRYQEVEGEYRAVKFLEGWGSFVRDVNDHSKWVAEEKEYGKITVHARSVVYADHNVREDY